MSTEPKKAFNAVVDAYETWRDKRDISRQQRSAALGALSTFIHEMGWRVRFRTSLSSVAGAGARAGGPYTTEVA